MSLTLTERWFPLFFLPLFLPLLLPLLLRYYILYDLIPSRTLTGGPWYTDTELDTQFIEGEKNRFIGVKK